MMAIAMTLVDLGVTDRDLYMFDTFTEMPLPDSDDDHVTAGPLAEGAAEWLQDPVFSFLPLDQVKANLEGTGYPAERLHFVQGLVEDTIPAQRARAGSRSAGWTPTGTGRPCTRWSTSTRGSRRGVSC